MSKLIEKGPKCRQAGESKAECVSRKVGELIEEGYKQDQAVAIANDMCSVRCEDLKCLQDFVATGKANGRNIGSDTETDRPKPRP